MPTRTETGRRRDAVTVGGDRERDEQAEIEDRDDEGRRALELVSRVTAERASDDRQPESTQEDHGQHSVGRDEPRGEAVTSTGCDRDEVQPRDEDRKARDRQRGRDQVKRIERTVRPEDRVFEVLVGEVREEAAHDEGRPDGSSP